MAKVLAGEAERLLPAAGSQGTLENQYDAEARRAVMYAHVGDRLIAEGDAARSGLIIGVPHHDGSPPYIVKWLSDGHIAMVWPGDFARIIPAGPPSSNCHSLPEARSLLPREQ